MTDQLASAGRQRCGRVSRFWSASVLVLLLVMPLSGCISISIPLWRSDSDETVVGRLLDHRRKAEVEQREANFQELHKAAAAGDVERTLSLLRAEEGWALPALKQAARSGQWPLVRTLLQIDRVLDRWELNGPLESAIQQQQYDVVASLLARGAWPRGGVVTAASQGNLTMVLLLLKAGGRTTGLIRMAVEERNPRMLRVLLDAGAPADDGAGKDEVTPLMVAARKGDLGMVRTLLAACADRSRRGGRWPEPASTAGEIAARLGYAHIVAALQAEGPGSAAPCQRGG